MVGSVEPHRKQVVLVVARSSFRIGRIVLPADFPEFAERMDGPGKNKGLSPLRAFFLVVPLAMPGVVGFGVLHFVLSWQDHLLPLVALDDENITLPLALTKLRDASFRIPEAVGMAAACLSLLPVLVLFGLCMGNMKTALREVVQS